MREEVPVSALCCAETQKECALASPVALRVCLLTRPPARCFVLCMPGARSVLGWGSASSGAHSSFGRRRLRSGQAPAIGRVSAVCLPAVLFHIIIIIIQYHLPDQPARTRDSCNTVESANFKRIDYCKTDANTFALTTVTYEKLLLASLT